MEILRKEKKFRSLFYLKALITIENFILDLHLNNLALMNGLHRG